MALFMLQLTSILGAAASVVHDDLSLSEGLHLLQLKAKTTASESYADAYPPWSSLSPQIQRANERSRGTYLWSKYDGPKLACKVGGDPHVSSYFRDKNSSIPETLAGRCHPQGPGIYPVLTKKDGSEAVQMYSLGCPVGLHPMSWASHFPKSDPRHFQAGQNIKQGSACSQVMSWAFKFDDLIVRVHPDMDLRKGGEPRVRICCNQDPLARCMWLNRASHGHYATPICGTNGPNQVAVYFQPKPSPQDVIITRESTGFKAIILLRRGEKEYKDIHNIKRWSWASHAELKMLEPQQEGTLDVCFENDSKWRSQYENALDARYNDVGFKDFGTWHAHDNPATPFHESPMFTQEDHDMFCNKGFWDEGKSCDNTTLFLDPLPKSDQLCSKNNCPYSMAQDLCEATKVNDMDYEDCLFDYCDTCDEAQAADWAEWEKIEHPSPVCADGMETCTPATICSAATRMNLLHLVHNNLGGAGPDSGLEEMRYSHVATLNGERVDLVVTVNGEYEPKKAGKGLSGSLGVINVACGTEVSLDFKIVNSATGVPIPVDNIAISWYDIDEGRRSKGRSTVTSCGDGLITASDSELVVAQVGQCWSATSSTPGTKADNPSAAFPLTDLQMGRVATFVFSGVSSFTSILKVDGGRGGRNFLFAIEPGVACKGGDSE